MPIHEPSKVFDAICKIIVDTVNEIGPLGSPISALYLPFMTGNLLNFETFDVVIRFLVFTKQVRQSGDCLYPVAKAE